MSFTEANTVEQMIIEADTPESLYSLLTSDSGDASAFRRRILHPKNSCRKTSIAIPTLGRK
jgi:hypothetical protein